MITTDDSKLVHSATEGAGVHTKNSCRALVSVDNPSGMLQDRNDMAPFDLLKGERDGC